MNIDQRVGLDGFQLLEVDTGTGLCILLKRGCDIIRGNNHKPGDRSNPLEEREREKEMWLKERQRAKRFPRLLLTRHENVQIVVTTSCAQCILDRAVSWYFYVETDRVES